MATCLDKIFCENALSCEITLFDEEGNPIDPLMLRNGDNVVISLKEKTGHIFLGWFDENDNPYYYDTLGDNRYMIRNIDCSKQYIAVHCPIEYAINVSSTNGCFVPYVMQATYGNIVRVHAEETPRCHFLNWTKNGILYSEERDFEYVVTENTSFVAHYDSIKYRLTVIPEKRNRGYCIGSGTYDLNESVEISAMPNTGYQFERWEDGVTSSVRTVTVVSSKTYKALFSVIENTVSAPQVSGGSVIGAGTYKTGEIASLQVIPQQGWTFSHWVVGGETYYDKTVNFVVTEDVNAIPYFNRGNYTVDFLSSPENYGYFSPTPAHSYSYGDTINIEAVPNEGYVFSNWSDGFPQARRTITVSGNAKYTAIFKRPSSTTIISVIMPDSGYVCPIYVGDKDIAQQFGTENRASVLPGAQITLAPVVPEGSKLATVTDSNGNVVWSNNGNTSSPIVEYTVGDENEQLTLNFENETFNLGIALTPLNSETSGLAQFVVTCGQIYDVFTLTTQNPNRNYSGILYGTNAMISAPANFGNYRFSYWCTDSGSFTTPTINVEITKNTKCAAVFEKVPN